MTRQPDNQPDLTVGVAVSDTRIDVAPLLECLSRLPSANRFELILGGQLGPNQRAAGQRWGAAFLRYLPLPRETNETRSETRARIALAAGGEFLAFVEDHAFPCPTWSEALLAAFDRGWDVVGFGFGNANPNSAWSWANLLMHYGPLMGLAEPVETHHLSAESIAYRTATIRALGGESLGALLCHDMALHRHLANGAAKLGIEPRATMLHHNLTGWRDSLLENFAGSRRYAAVRGAEWRKTKRLTYALGCFLLPPLRVARVRRLCQERELRPQLPRFFLAALIYAALCSALGEFVGYLSGRPGGDFGVPHQYTNDDLERLRRHHAGR